MHTQESISMGIGAEWEESDKISLQEAINHCVAPTWDVYVLLNLELEKYIVIKVCFCLLSKCGYMCIYLYVQSFMIYS